MWRECLGGCAVDVLFQRADGRLERAMGPTPSVTMVPVVMVPQMTTVARTPSFSTGSAEEGRVEGEEEASDSDDGGGGVILAPSSHSGLASTVSIDTTGVFDSDSESDDGETVSSVGMPVSSAISPPPPPPLPKLTAPALAVRVNWAKMAPNRAHAHPYGPQAEDINTSLHILPEDGSVDSLRLEGLSVTPAALPPKPPA